MGWICNICSNPCELKPIGRGAKYTPCHCPYSAITTVGWTEKKAQPDKLKTLVIQAETLDTLIDIKQELRKFRKESENRR